jgi:mannosyltransferase OCH1-like enzyme
MAIRTSQFAKDMPFRDIDDDSKWEIIENLYDKFLSNNKTSIYPNRIPKIIHQIWLGDNPIPERYVECMKTIKEVNSDYWHKLWTDEDVKNFGLINQKIYDECNNYGVRSDLFRYEILQRYGGIYMDTDFIAHKPFDNLLGFDFFAGTGCVNKVSLQNSIIASIPNHPIMNLAIKKLTPKIPHPTFSNMNTEVLGFTGPYFLTECFLEATEETHNAVILPEKYFYSFPNIHKDNYEPGMIDLYKTEDSYCSHLWGCSWMK